MAGGKIVTIFTEETFEVSINGYYLNGLVKQTPGVAVNDLAAVVLI